MPARAMAAVGFWKGDGVEFWGRAAWSPVGQEIPEVCARLAGWLECDAWLDRSVAEAVLVVAAWGLGVWL